jgi:hypothetical protein
MLIQLLVQKNSVGKDPKITSMLFMGPSQLTLGVLILIFKNDAQQKKFMENFLSLVAKVGMSICIMEN